MTDCCGNTISYLRIIGRKNELFGCHNLDIIHSYEWQLYHSLSGIIEKLTYSLETMSWLSLGQRWLQKKICFSCSLFCI